MGQRIVQPVLILLIAFPFIAVPTAKAVYPLTIELPQEVHFLTPEGEEVLAPLGTYEVSEVESGVTLIPTGKETADQIVVEAHENHHDEVLAWPMVVTLPAEAWDKYILLLLLPDGKVLESLGSYSGVRTRTAKGMSALGPRDGTAQLHQRYAKIVQLEKQKIHLQQQVGRLKTQVDSLRRQVSSPKRDVEISMLQLDLQQSQQEQSQIMQTFAALMKQWHETQKSIIENLK